MNATYPSDVKLLSDEELVTLADELQEAFQREDHETDYEYWTDDDAESRYYEMREEKRRRFMLANPDWKPPTPQQMQKLLNEAMSALCENLRPTAALFSLPDGATKIGDMVTIPRPPKFTERI